MKDIAPPEVLNQRSVTIVRLGEDYEIIYENMLGSLPFLDQLAESVTPPCIVMQHVKFIGSAFLGRLVTLHKLLTARDSGRFALCGLSTFCRTAISATKLDELFEVFDSVDAAVLTFAKDL
jgi:anti-sigma B factor antagonist